MGLIGKQFELLKEVAPVATCVAVLVDPTHPAHELRLPGFQAVTRSLGLDLHLVEVRDLPNERERAFAALVHERIDAIDIAGGPRFPPTAHRL